MKKNLLAITVALFCSTAALSQYTGPQKQSGGFTGPSKQNHTIIEAKQLPDDSKITLQGKIIEHLGGDKYLFSDGHDTITIEIDYDDWHGVQVGPKDTVILYGEVDKERHHHKNEVKIDVDRVIKK